MEEITANDIAEFRDRGMNRETDVEIPEKVQKVEKLLIPLREKCRSCRRQRFPHEYLYDILLHANLEFRGEVQNSWLMAAADANIPIFVPGWKILH